MVEQAPARAASALVEVGWHDSDSDTKKHCTVDYKNGKGRFIKRKLVCNTDETNT